MRVVEFKEFIQTIKISDSGFFKSVLEKLLVMLYYHLAEQIKGIHDKKNRILEVTEIYSTMWSALSCAIDHQPRVRLKHS